MPILRVYDSARARKFCLDWLGFTIDFEHRSPGSVVWIPARRLGTLRDKLIANPAEQLRPGIDRDAPGGATMTVTDPFGNELRFCEPTTAS